MTTKPHANVFRLLLPQDDVLVYRTLRDGVPRDAREFVRIGKFAYSETNLGSMEAVRASPIVLKQFISRNIGQAVQSDSRLFDVNEFAISASVANNPLHREEIFSIVQAFDLQIIFDRTSFFLAILPFVKIYNRLRLSAVIDLLGRNTLTVPLRGLCFAGTAGSERWQDCRVLGIPEGTSCLVQLFHEARSEITVPLERVIPKLPIGLVRALKARSGSHGSIDALLQSTRKRGALSDGASFVSATEAVRSNYIASYFPVEIGTTLVSLDLMPTTLESLKATRIDPVATLTSPIDQTHATFEHVVSGLSSARASNVRDETVALFCTPSTKQAAQRLIEELNAPTENVGGFKGMPVHFGVRLKEVPTGPVMVSDVEDYVERAEEFALSSDQVKQSAFAVFMLGDDQESFRSPVPLYYRLKAVMARTGYPCQVIEPRTIDEKFARWNLALNIAAKLGITPWTLAAGDALRPVDLFLGFSYSSLFVKELGVVRNIGYVNVFDKDATWKMLWADAHAFGFEDRFKVFPKIAADAIHAATDSPESLRLIEIHYNKRFGKRERDAILDGIRRAAPRASVIFVSLSPEHPIRFIDSSRADYCTARGTLWCLDSYTGYLQTVGLSKTSRLPRPVRLSAYFERSEVPQGVEDVARRILTLTQLNWRSVRDYAALPVTISYSSLVARLTNYFGLADWEQFVNHRLKRTPWFL